MNKTLCFFITVLSCILISCNNGQNNRSDVNADTAVMSSSVSNTAASLTGCYAMIQQRDTAMLGLNVVDSNVTGKLEYRRFEKDDNSGTIDGVVRGDLIIANYTFQSEGMKSVREVAFSVKRDSLFEGYGEILVKKDTAKFVNVGRLKFMETPFLRIECGK